MIRYARLEQPRRQDSGAVGESRQDGSGEGRERTWHRDSISYRFKSPLKIGFH